MADEPKIDVDLNGQVALVTGASQGIGKAIAIALARCGARVACVARSEDKLKQTVADITEQGGNATAFPCDVTKSEEVTKLVEKIAEDWQRLDILVNNAGITRDTLIPRMADEQWDEVLNTNLRGAFLFTRAATRPMMSQRLRSHHQHLKCLGPHGQPRPGELLRLEGWPHRHDAHGGPRAGGA